MDKNEVYRNIGRNIKYHRKRLRLSQTDLAIELGVTKQLISRYESAMSRISLYNLIRIADVFAMPIRDLIPDPTTVVVYEQEARESVGV